MKLIYYISLFECHQLDHRIQATVNTKLIFQTPRIQLSSELMKAPVSLSKENMPIECLTFQVQHNHPEFGMVPHILNFKELLEFRPPTTRLFTVESRTTPLVHPTHFIHQCGSRMNPHMTQVCNKRHDQGILRWKPRWCSVQNSLPSSRCST